MMVNQLPSQTREFAQYLTDLLDRLDQDSGWCGVFWARDPDGMTACLDGREVPPWDVVAALLQDLAAAHGPALADRETVRARALHTASLTAYDALPGGRDALGDRLDVMLRERRYAAERLAELDRALDTAATPGHERQLRVDLAWAQDDHERATLRCAEIRRRLDELDRGARPRTVPAPAASAPAVPAPAVPAPAPVSRPRGARFAGGAEEPADRLAPAEPLPALPGPQRSGAVPRGARFAGAAVDPAEQRPPAPLVDDADRRATQEAVAALVALRAQGRSGEAHSLLARAATWPPARFPLLAAELRGAGLGADWPTLLWEAASLPAERLCAAADALRGAGLDDDGRQLLRQGVTRPAEEIGGAVLTLTGEGRDREARALLDAYLRVRGAQDAARTAERDPNRLVPLLLAVAEGISAQHRRDVLHALRVAGLTT